MRFTKGKRQVQPQAPTWAGDPPAGRQLFGEGPGGPSGQEVERELTRQSM